jgi:hypothetical protein
MDYAFLPVFFLVAIRLMLSVVVGTGGVFLGRFWSYVLRVRTTWKYYNTV